MPIIPRADESQVLNAGSPVAISGTNESRTLTNAGDEFGSALMKLGQVTHRLNAESKRQRAKATADASGSDFETDLAVIGQRIKESPSYGVDDSAALLEAYKKEASITMDAYAAKLSDDNNEKLLFIKDAKDKIAAHGLKFFSDSVSAYNKVTKDNLDKFISREGTKVANSLDKETAYNSLAHIEAKVKEYSFLDNAEKQDMLTNARKEIMGSLIDGHVQRILMSNDPAERAALEKKAMQLFTIQYTQREDGKVAPALGVAGVFTDKEREHLYNKIGEARWKADNRDISMKNALEARDEKTLKRQQEYTFRSMVSEIYHNVKDGETFKVANDRIDQMVATQQLTPQKADTLRREAGKNLYFQKREEDSTAASQYVETFAQELLDQGNNEKALTSAYEAIDKYKVSGETAIKLMDASDVVTKAMQKDPGLAGRVKEEVRRINRPLTWPGYSTLKREDQIKIQDTVRAARNKLYNAFLQNPNFNAADMSKGLLNNDILPVIEKYNIIPKNKPSDVELKKQRIYDEYETKKKLRKLTEDQKKEYKKQIIKLNNSIKDGGE